MKKANSLYQLVKKQANQQKSSLKVICDWDDTIQAYQSKVLYELCEECKDSPSPFECFFKNWSIKMDEIKEKNDFYDRAPFLTIADELLLLVKEGLIRELVFLSYFNKRRFPNGDVRKEEKFQNTFGKLSPIMKIDMKLISSSSKAQWILENHPDFDIFIDDLPSTISESAERFSTDKIFVIPNQELNFGINSRRTEGENIYHLLTSVSSLNEKDFEAIVQVVQEKNVCYESKILYYAKHNEQK